MNAPSHKRKPNYLMRTILGGMLLLLSIAGAASAGEGGDGGMNWTVLLLILTGGGLLTAAVLHVLGKSSQARRATSIFAIVGVISGIALVFVAFVPEDGAAAGKAPAAIAETAGSTNYAKTIDLTVVVRDFHTGSAVGSADVYLYKNSSGYSLQQLLQRSVPSAVSCTSDSNGKCTIEAIPAEVYDVCASKAGYYTAFEACQFGIQDTAKQVASAIDTSPGYTITGIHLRQHGTGDLAKTSSTIGSSGCTAGTSTCPLTIFFGNTKADSIIAYPAVKLTPKVTSSSATTNNLTFASIQSGSACQYAVVNSVYYVYDPAVDMLKANQYGTCGVNFNYASGSTDAKIGLALDDGFMPRMYASMASRPGGVPVGDFETNSNWPDLDAVTLDVTR